MLHETVVKILLLNEKYEVLVLQTGKYKEHPEKEHKPDLPGGVVDKGESERDAVVRELYEETGIEIDLTKIILGYTETGFYPKENKSVNKMLYIAYLDHTPSVSISWEHESCEWSFVGSIMEQYELRPFYRNAVGSILNNQLV